MKERAYTLIPLGIVYLSLSSPAAAYLDGATGSMILQAVIGGAATAMIFGRRYLRKVKSIFTRDRSKAESTSEK